jgi:hypothetical protein
LYSEISRPGLGFADSKEQLQQQITRFWETNTTNSSRSKGASYLSTMAATLAAIHAATEFVVGTNDMSIDNWTFKLFYQG